MQLKKMTTAILISLGLHMIIMLMTWSLPAFHFLKDDTSNPLKLRIVGEDKGLEKDLIFIKPKKKPVAKKALQQQLEFPSLSPLSDRISKKAQQNKKQNLLKPTKAIDNLKISNRTIKGFLKNDQNYEAPSQVLSAMEYTDVNFDLEVPKGIKEDELNQHELVFYSFRRRTALAYVNAFYKELNNFELRNPHLRFPLTSSKQEIAGRITYDKNGDILRIETLKYTNITQLQDFFMDVLKNMNALPNPPKEIINKKEQFVVNFVLTVNGARAQ